jgi:uracil-DNA glycosylase
VTGQAAELDRVLAAIRSCRQCVEAPQGKPLPHEPRPVLRASSTARLAVCSQAPGTKCFRHAGWMGVSPEEFYDEARVAIVPMGFCFPGQDAHGADLPPRRECATLWHRKLFAALPQLELVLAVGSYAQRFHLGLSAGATLQDTMVAWRQQLKRKQRLRVLPLPHPSWRNNAWLKQNPWFEKELLPVLRREVRAL